MSNEFFNHQPQGDHVMDRYAFYACTYLDKENELPSNRQYRYCYQRLEGTEFEFAGYFSDKRYMASDRRRFGLLKMMKAAEEGQFNKILMNDINRMALNRDNLVEIVRRFKHVGVEVYTNLGKAAPLSWQLAEEIRLAEEDEVYLAAQEWEAREDNLFEDYVSHQESAQTLNAQEEAMVSEWGRCAEQGAALQREQAAQEAQAQNGQQNTGSSLFTEDDIARIKAADEAEKQMYRQIATHSQGQAPHDTPEARL